MTLPPSPPKVSCVLLPSFGQVNESLSIGLQLSKAPALENSPFPKLPNRSDLTSFVQALAGNIAVS